MPPRGHQSWLTLYFYQQTSEVGVFLAFRKGEFSDLAYEKLLEEQGEINEELGIEVEWKSENGKNRITINMYLEELFAENSKEKIKCFFEDSVNRFVNVFRPRLQ